MSFQLYHELLQFPMLLVLGVMGMVVTGSVAAVDECGGVIKMSSGSLEYKLETPYLVEETCAWILIPNPDNVTRLGLQLVLDGFPTAAPKLGIFAVSEGGDLETLQTLRKGDREDYTWTAHIFLIIFTSSTSTTPGTGFSLTFNTLETFCTYPSLHTKHLLIQSPVGSYIRGHWPAPDAGYGANELWLMVFHPPYGHEASVSVGSIDIEFNCSHDKFLVYYTYAGVPQNTVRLCHVASPGSYALGSIPLIMTFRSNGEEHGFGFDYSTSSWSAPSGGKLQLQAE